VQLDYVAGTNTAGSQVDNKMQAYRCQTF